MWYECAVCPCLFGSRPRSTLLVSSCWVTFLLGGACNVYTPDLLRSAAGATGVAKGGASVQGGSVGTTSLSAPTSGGRSNGSSGGVSIGGQGTLAGATATATAGGVGSTTTAAGGSTSNGSSSSGAAGTQNGAGTAGSGGGSGVGGANSIICFLDDMNGSEASGPLRGCDGSRTSWWESYLPPAGAIVSGTIQPDPGLVFQRATATPDDQAKLGVRWLTTVSGKVVVTDNKKYFGARFPFYVGAPYTTSGMILHFYYRTRYSAPIAPLRVNLPIPTTTFVADDGGTCSVNCGNHFGADVPNTGGEWNQWSLRIESTKAQGDLSQIWEPAPRDVVSFDPNQVLAIEFGTSTAQQFEFSIGPVWLEWKITSAN